MKDGDEGQINYELIGKYLPGFCRTSLYGNNDSDQHIMSLFSIALVCKGKTFVELGVRAGTTTLPILLAAHLNGGELVSVDIQDTEFQCPKELKPDWSLVKANTLDFLVSWDKSKRMGFVYVDDWHAYEHVEKELEYLDMHVGPSSVILLYDLMYRTEPFYHSDLTLKKGVVGKRGTISCIR